MFFSRKQEFLSFPHKLEDGRRMEFDGFWPGFRPAEDHAFWTELLPRFCDKDIIRVLGPFWRSNNRPDLLTIRDEKGPWDYFLTGECRDNPVDLARKCIGFRLPRTAGEFRFPYWKWYLTWPGFETAPPYKRFGERLSIDRLMRPINDVFAMPSREEFDRIAPKAVLITSHFKRHRRRLWRMTDKAMGCDAFGRKIRPTDLPKTELLGKYPFNLCPENRVGEGYITEKTPEAFLCGCIPITYCHPDDLARDFNPRAVINLHGLSMRQSRRVLEQVSGDYETFRALRAEPLLLEEPSIEPLYDFLEK